MGGGGEEGVLGGALLPVSSGLGPPRESFLELSRPQQQARPLEASRYTRRKAALRKTSVLPSWRVGRSRSAVGDLITWHLNIRRSC